MGLLTILSSGGSPVPDAGDDFFTLCFPVTMLAGVSDLTLLEGTDYNLPAGLQAEDVWVRINSSRATGRGAVSGGGNQEPREVTTWLTTDTDGITKVRIRRVAIITAVGVTIQIVCVIKPSSSSRFWVRQSSAGALTASTATLTGGALDSPIVDPAKVLVCITGQSVETTVRGRAHGGKFTAEMSGGLAKLTRGDTANLSRVSWAVIEFAEDWSDVQRFAFDSPGTGAAGEVWSSVNQTNSVQLSITGDLGGTALANFSQAFLETQFRNDRAANEGNDDQGEVVELTGTNELTVRKSVHANPTLKHHVVWGVEWIGQAGATAPIVEHVSVYEADAATATEHTTTRTITAVGSTTNTSIEGASVSADGTGARFPRGNVDFCIVTNTTVEEVETDSQVNQRRAYTVFQWPVGITPPALPGTFRLQRQHPGPDALSVGSPGALRSRVGNPGPEALGASSPGPVRSQAQRPGAESMRSGHAG